MYKKVSILYKSWWSDRMKIIKRCSGHLKYINGLSSSKTTSGSTSARGTPNMLSSSLQLKK